MSEHGLKHPEIYPYDMIKEKLLAIPDPITKALFCCMYAGAFRVSEVISISKQDVIEEIDQQGRRILKITSKNLKNRTRDMKNLPINREIEEWLAAPILEYANTFLDLNDVLFPYHRTTIFRWCIKHFNFNPHGWRKIRLTHLAVLYHFTDRQLVRYSGWSDARPAESYISLVMGDITPERRD